MKRRAARSRRRTERDTEGTRVPTGAPNPRTLPQFRREVAALLVAGNRGVFGEQAVRLIAKYDKFVRYGWDKGRAPCWVADNIMANEKKVRASGTFERARDPSSRRRRHVGRDAENPREGEVFESKAGARWQVGQVSDTKRGKRIKVKRVGYRDAGELTWAPDVLKQMKQLKSEAAREIAKAEHHLAKADVVQASSRPTQDAPMRTRGPMTRRPGGEEGEQLSLSQRLFGRDLDGKKRRYYVYVIEAKRGAFKVLYVGHSWHTPQERLRQHKLGKAYCQNCKPKRYAKGTSFRLVSSLTVKKTFLARKDAELAERKLARLLKSKGHIVEGGH